MGTGPFPHDRIPKGQQWDDEGKVSELGCVNSCYKNQCMGTGPFPHDRIPKGQQWDDEGKVSDLGCCTGFLGECIKCCPPSDDDTAVAMSNQEVEAVNPKQGDAA